MPFYNNIERVFAVKTIFNKTVAKLAVLQVMQCMTKNFPRNVLNQFIKIFQNGIILCLKFVLLH